jgi:carboxyl-terminal processing protease
MQKFKQFMKSRKGLLLLAIVLFGGLFFAFKSSNLGLPVTPLTQKQHLLMSVGSILENQHYSPKNINDAFSKMVFKKYLEDMDGDKSLFLQADITELKKFETAIDDEIHGADILFAPAVSFLKKNRLFWKEISLNILKMKRKEKNGGERN